MQENFEEKQCKYTVPDVKRQHLPKPCLCKLKNRAADVSKVKLFA